MPTADGLRSHSDKMYPRLGHVTAPQCPIPLHCAQAPNRASLWRQPEPRFQVVPVVHYEGLCNHVVHRWSRGQHIKHHRIPLKWSKAWISYVWKLTKYFKTNKGQTINLCLSLKKIDIILRNCITSSQVSIYCWIATRWKQLLDYTSMYWFYFINLGHPLKNPRYCHIRVET